MILSKLSRLALKTLGDMIRVARLERGMSQSNLAGRINVSRYSIMAIEKGDPKVAIGIVLEAAVIVGIPLLADDIQEMQKLEHTVVGFKALLPKRIRGKKEQINDNF